MTLAPPPSPVDRPGQRGILSLQGLFRPIQLGLRWSDSTGDSPISNPGWMPCLQYRLLRKNTYRNEIKPGEALAVLLEELKRPITQTLVGRQIARHPTEVRHVLLATQGKPGRTVEAINMLCDAFSAGSAPKVGLEGPGVVIQE